MTTPALHPGRLRPALALLLCAPTLLSPAQAGSGTDASLTGRTSVRRGTTADTAPARVIVQYRADSALMTGGADATTRRVLASTGRVQPLHAGTLATRLGIALSDRHVLGARMQSLEVSDGSVDADTLAARLAAQADVEWAVPVRRRQIASATAPNDPLYGSGLTGTTPAAGQWYLRAPAWPVVSGMDAPAAWARGTGSSSVVVAVLDTGVRTDHPDLAGKLVSGHDFVRAAVSNDGDGADSDPTDPGDWCASDATPYSSWHGTQTASLVGARTDDGTGMAGTAPAVMVQPVRVLGQCGGYDDDIIAGMRYAGGLSTTVSNATPAQVINMSLGGSPGEACNNAYQSAITALNAAGVTVVVAAGNEALAVGSPANCSGVIAVAALRHVGTKVGFSSLGSEVAISAPGGNCVNETGTCLYPIITATNSGTGEPSSNTWTDGTDYAIGTSFSAPLVAGTAALMRSVNPALTPAQIKSLLQSTARAFPTIGAQDDTAGACQTPGSTAQTECYCTTSTCGAGMLDTGAAVAAAVGATPTVRAVIAASSQSPTAGRTLTLSGASSSRSATAWQWQLLGGTGSAAFTSATSGSGAARTTLQIRAPGSFIVALTVSDGSGSSDTTQATLVSPPTVVISGATSVAVGGSVALNASSTAYGGRDIASHSWRISSGSSRATISGTTGSTATVTATATGAITAELTVTDSAGVSSTESWTLTATSSSGGAGSGGSGGSSSGSASGGGAQGLASGLALGLLAAWLNRQRRRSSGH